MISGSLPFVAELEAGLLVHPASALSAAWEGGQWIKCSGVMADEHPFIVMELLAGEILADRLDREGELSYGRRSGQR